MTFPFSRIHFLLLVNIFKNLFDVYHFSENSNDLQPPEAEDDPPSYIEVCGDDQEESSVRVSKLSIDAPPAYRPPSDS